MYTVKLPNGTLTNLELNGNNYIASEVVSDEMFSDLSSVQIIDEDTEQVATYTDMKLIKNTAIDGRSWFILAEKTTSEKFVETVNSAIESNSNDLTDVQMALADLYEMIIGG